MARRPFEDTSKKKKQYLRRAYDYTFKLRVISHYRTPPSIE